MELAFLTLLLKDGADRVSRGIAINNKGVFETGLVKDRGGAHGVDEGLEGRFVFIFPVKFATFSAESYKGVERSREHTEVPNVHAIEIEETQESS